MRIQALGLFGLLAAAPAQAEQHWGCTRGTTWSGMAKPVLWLSISSQNTGTVQLNGDEIRTTYAQTGLNRTWYWSPNDEGFYQHSVSLRGDGIALLFDFSERLSAGEEEGRSPPKFYTCREFSPKSKREIQGLANGS